MTIEPNSKFASNTIYEQRWGWQREIKIWHKKRPKKMDFLASIIIHNASVTKYNLSTL